MEISVEHIGLAAKNPRDLAEWYSQVLGAKIVLRIEGDAPAFFVQFGKGLVLELYTAEKGMEETGYNRLAGWRHLALRVDSIDKTKGELEGLAVKFTEAVKPAGGGGKVLFFKDPEGNLLHLVERPAEVGRLFGS